MSSADRRCSSHPAGIRRSRLSAAWRNSMLTRCSVQLGGIRLGESRRRAARVFLLHFREEFLRFRRVAEHVIHDPELEDRVRHFWMVRKALLYLRKRVTGTFEIGVRQCKIRFAQPVVGVTRVLAVGIPLQETIERIDSRIELAVCNELVSGRIVRLLIARRRRRCTGTTRDRGGRWLARRWRNGASRAAHARECRESPIDVEILFLLTLFEAADLVGLLLHETTQLTDLILQQ